MYDSVDNKFFIYQIDEQKQDFFFVYVLVGIISVIIVFFIVRKGYFPVEFLFVEKYKQKLYYFKRKKRWKNVFFLLKIENIKTLIMH